MEDFRPEPSLHGYSGSMSGPCHASGPDSDNLALQPPVDLPRGAKVLRNWPSSVSRQERRLPVIGDTIFLL